jgi:hypothetical protein
MGLPEDGPKCGPKHVATVNYNQCEQLDWFICIVLFTAKYQQPCYTTGFKQWRQSILVRGPVGTRDHIFDFKTFARFEVRPPLRRKKRPDCY